MKHLSDLQQCTFGSSAAELPPPVETLYKSFTAPHRKRGVPTRLTVGARALTKHCHRSSDGWWGGEIKGSDSIKCEAAVAVLQKILRNAYWINIHALPVSVNFMWSTLPCTDDRTARFGRV